MARATAAGLPAMTFHLPKKSKLDFALTLALVGLAFGWLFLTVQAMNAVADDRRAEISELKRSTSEQKSATAELERSNGLDSIGNNERSALILELDAALNSTEGFLQ